MGLQYLHEQSIAHGDLKDVSTQGSPNQRWLTHFKQNVLVNSSLDAVLCDYGLSELNNENDSSGFTTNQNLMSVRFASPELLDGSSRNLASDVWAWGCLFFKVNHLILPPESI